MPLNVIGKIRSPCSCHAGIRRGRDGRKIVPVRNVFSIVGFGGVRFTLCHPIEIHNAFAQMDMVAGNSDNPLDQKTVLAVGLDLRFVED